MENKRLTSVDLSGIEFYKASKKRKPSSKDSLNAASFGAKPLPIGNKKLPNE